MITTIKIPTSKSFLENMRARASETGGEVVITARSPKNGIWLHTKSFYPPKTYRLPTGRINPCETPEAAFHREILEELGKPAHISLKLGVLKYIFENGSECVEFESHIFLAAETFQQPHPINPEESISQFIETDTAGLRSAAAQLSSLPDDWRDWGIFRAPAHIFTADRLEELDK